MDSIGGRGDASAAWPASVGVEAEASRQLGHSPCGASTGMGALHLGQLFRASVFIVTVPEEIQPAGYKKNEGKRAGTPNELPERTSRWCASSPPLRVRSELFGQGPWVYASV